MIAKNLGVTPVLSLVGMYLGMKVMGVIGLIIVPTLLMVIIQILKVKYQLKNKVEIQKYLKKVMYKLSAFSYTC